MYPHIWVHISERDSKVIGHIPAGWFPSKIEVSKDGKKLIIANAKGYGSGPNGGADFDRGPEGSYIGSLMKGTIQVVDVPSDEELKNLTKEVISNICFFLGMRDEGLYWLNKAYEERSSNIDHLKPFVPKKYLQDPDYLKIMNKIKGRVEWSY